jgi:hypothetical protein
METLAGRLQPIVYVDTSEVRDGRLKELKAAMDDLTATSATTGLG